MVLALKSKPGLTGASALSIPKDWDATWFRGFINNLLKGADVRNAVGVNGITVSGTIASPYATISLGVGTTLVGAANEISITTAGGVTTIGFAPNIVIPAPASGNTLTINSVGVSAALDLNSSSSALPAYMELSQAGVGKGFFGVDGGQVLAAGSTNGDIVLRSDSGGVIRISGNAGASSHIIISNTGLASFFGTTLGSGIASATQVFIAGALSASFGWCNSSNGADSKIFDSFVDASATLHLRAVNDAYTAATDWCTIVRSGTSIVSISLGGSLVIHSDGGVTIGSPTGGSKGAGTLNVQNGVFLNGTAYTNP
jgi:hypothetical protein